MNRCVVILTTSFINETNASRAFSDWLRHSFKILQQIKTKGTGIDSLFSASQSDINHFVGLSMPCGCQTTEQRFNVGYCLLINRATTNSSS